MQIYPRFPFGEAQTRSPRFRRRRPAPNIMQGEEGFTTLQAILRLEFVPCLVQCAEHGTSNHSLLGRRVRRDLKQPLH